MLKKGRKISKCGKKTQPIRHLLAHPAGVQETELFLRVAWGDITCGGVIGRKSQTTCSKANKTEINCCVHITILKQGPHCTGKTRKMAPENSLSGKTQGIWKNCQNTGNLVCSKSKFPDSKDRGYWFSNLSKSVSLMKMAQISEIVRGKISSWTLDREKTGNLEIGFWLGISYGKKPPAPFWL